MRTGRHLKPHGVIPGTFRSAEGFKCKSCRRIFRAGTYFTIVCLPKKAWWGCVECGENVAKFNE